MDTRCEEVIVQLVVRDYDEHGRPIGEKVSQPVKMFRGAAANFWGQVDAAVAQLGAQDAPAPAPPAIVKGKRGKR